MMHREKTAQVVNEYGIEEMHSIFVPIFVTFFASNTRPITDYMCNISCIIRTV